MCERYRIKSKRLARGLGFLAAAGILISGFLSSLTVVFGIRLIQSVVRNIDNTNYQSYQHLLLVITIITLPVCLLGVSCFWICLRQAIQAAGLFRSMLVIGNTGVSVIRKDTVRIEIPWSAVQGYDRQWGGGFALRYLADNRKKSLYLIRSMFSENAFKHIAKRIEHDLSMRKANDHENQKQSPV